MHSTQPRIILCLNKRDKNSLILVPNKGELFNNPEVGIIFVPVIENSSSKPAYYPGDALVNQLERDNLIQAGYILIKSPFNDSYHLATEASETFAHQKHFIFTKICGYLGAREVLIEELKISNQSKVQHFKSQLGLEDKASLVSASGQISMDREQAEKIESKFILRTTFEGSKPNFPEVERLINENRLTNEENINFVVGLRKANLATNQELNLDLSRESSRNFDMLGNLLLGVPKLLAVKGIMEYQSSIKDMTKYNFSYKVTF